ncbi:response regulator transcription factor [Geobacter sp. SVR]|uniref:response regulator transcription factor n=1 Tax=Geobacter sp. SVR TaxID=2495594 RepID=UPI00143EF8E4|nr:response regulator transcription factor [Geobacter sp. SVR]BCS52868.1 transcriptional regulator [Geobacter sp. SVR]GCF87491.1 transcriptional regulator [Geobacter sp. SVR]
MDSAIRVLIVEDNNDLRESMVEYLGIVGIEAVGVASAAEFYVAVTAGSWNVVVADIGLPDQSGYVLVEYVRNNTTARVIILTARNALDDRIKGYGAGADLYLSKPVDSRELAAAIASLALRRTNDPQLPALSSPAPPQDAWSLSRSAWSLIAPDETVIALTSKELQFLELLAATPGMPVTREILLMKLYNRHDEYTNRSLDSLVRRLRAKIMAATDVPQPIKTAHAVGHCVSVSLNMV